MVLRILIIRGMRKDKPLKKWFQVFLNFKKGYLIGFTKIRFIMVLLMKGYFRIYEILNKN